MGGLGSFLFGSDSKMKQAPKYGEGGMQQLEAFQSGQNGIQDSPLYQAGSDWLLKLLSGDTSVFDQPLIDQFNQKTIPGIAERFGGIGAGSSSAMNQTLAQAGKDLTTQIASVRANLMKDVLGQGLSYANQPYANQLQSFGYTPFDNYQTEATQGLAAPLISGLASATLGPVGGAAGNYAASFIPKAG